MEDMATTTHLVGAPHQLLTIWLFRDVSNSGEIQERIVAGTVMPELAFINAKMVPDTIIVKAAAQKAVLANAKGALRSRSMHAELVFNLSGSKHVGESLKKFGIAGGCSDVLVASIHQGAPDEEHVKGLIAGKAHPLCELEGIADTAAMTKAYKIAPPELQVGTVADAILCRIAGSHC